MRRVKCGEPRIRGSNYGIAKVEPKYRDEFYISPSHKAWRAEVLRRANYSCQGAGPHSGVLHADHIVERSDGGEELDFNNGQALCAACHNRKTALDRSHRMLRPARVVTD